MSTTKIHVKFFMLNPPEESSPEEPPPKIEFILSLAFLITSSISGGASSLPQGSLLSFPFQDIFILLPLLIDYLKFRTL